MNRRPHGVNLDDGVALRSEEEFHLLFVDARPDARARLKDWLADAGQGAVLFAGQIGTGKTTLLNEVLQARPDLPMIRMRFDTDCIDATDGGYVLLMLGQILNACLERSVSVDGCGLAVADFAALECPDWTALAHILARTPATLSAADRLREFSVQIAPNAEHIRRASGELIARLSERLHHPAILVADGVDKLAPQTSDYDSIRKTLTFLADHKTLFEVNAVHLFREADFRPGIDRVFLGGMDSAFLEAVFAKRLGAYAAMYRQAFSLLTVKAGGNTRQGLRLLNAYYFLRTQRREQHEAAFASACHRVTSDLLSMPFVDFPAEIAEVVRRDGYIEGSVLENPTTAAEAGEAVYRNWFILDSAPTVETPTRWPAHINPLIEKSDWKPSQRPSAEEVLVQKWARQGDVGAQGLNAPLSDKGKPDWKRAWDEINAFTLAARVPSILDLLGEIGAGLFGLERRDRILVAYESRDNFDAIKKYLLDYVVGKANTYGAFPCREIVLVGGEGHHPVQQLLVELAERDWSTIYSVDVTGRWTEHQCRDLEHRRDLFDRLQMLWWIQQGDLEQYKPLWPQLRQTFRIYRLEEQLWRGLTLEEIESDIAVIESISSQPNSESIRRLQSVLKYLKERGKQA
jgi:hypothetical protein